MPQVKTFRAPTAYEEEMLKAQRQRQLAEMLQQQAFAPEAEPYTFQGFRAQPSAANAIARVLSAYTAKKIGEKAETAERAAREADIAGAEQVMRGLAPQARVAAPTAAEIAGSVGMPQISEEGAVSYGPTVQPQMRTEMVGPTAQQRRDLLTQTMVRGTPMARQLAQFLAAQEPKTTTTEFDGQLLNVTGDVATPVTMSGRPVATAPKPKTRTSSEDYGGFIRTYYSDGSYKDERKTAAPAGPRDEPLMLVDVNGVPTYTPRSKAIGQKAFVNKPAGGLTGDDKVDRRNHRNTRIQLQNAYDAISEFAREMKQTPKEESLVGEKAGRLSTKYKLALGAVRVLQNTGVLNPGELPFIEDTLRNPQSFTQLFNPASRETIMGQVESIADSLERQSRINDEQYEYDVAPLKGRDWRRERIPQKAVAAGLTQADWDAATEEEKAAWR